MYIPTFGISEDFFWVSMDATEETSWLEYLGTLFEYVQPEGEAPQKDTATKLIPQGMQNKQTSYLLEAEVARQRSARAGIIMSLPRFPTQPVRTTRGLIVLSFAFTVSELRALPQVFTNNVETEAARSAEWEAHRARCAVELHVWNTEARRWKLERAQLTEACVRIALANQVKTESRDLKGRE